MTEEQKQEPIRVLAQCPVCRHKIMSNIHVVISHYLVVIGQHGNQLQTGPSLPKMTCTNCGIEFFLKESLELLKKKEQGDPLLLQPDKRIVIGRA